MDELVAYYEKRTGIFDAGHSDDLRLAEMGGAVPYFTQAALRDLGVADDLEPGPVTAREERIREVREVRARMESR